MSVILVCDRCGDAICRTKTRDVHTEFCRVSGCMGAYRVRGETRGEPPLAKIIEATSRMKASFLDLEAMEDLFLRAEPCVALVHRDHFNRFGWMFPSTLAQRAERWMHSKGGRHVMRDVYALAAKFVPRWKRTGIPVSVAMLWEIERQKIKEVSARACKMGWRIKDRYGYTLNNSYRAYVARHIMDRRKDWEGLFEIREVKS